ncbi:hypothetical protein [Sulfurospirillum halorespirans]|uniref:hypothetical protein n=1 Tax=Sulfurospirillum halorespirans TaxID=194424 RepID=UPI00084A0001|nr:hypothetical protein [Sulfurospirillum halorespirans]
MPNKSLYSKEEITLFKTLEDSIDTNDYQPMNDLKLQGKKAFLQKVANATIKKKQIKSRSKFTNL